MAITTLDGLTLAAKQYVPFMKTASATTVANNWSTLFDLAGNPGAGTISIANTANGLVPTDATAGMQTIDAFGGGATGYITGVDWGSTVAARFLLYDRLFHCGSYAYNSGTTTLSAQPSYVGRLPGSSYYNLQIWVEVNQAWAASTASSVTVTYTSGDGSTAQTTGAYTLPTAVVTRRMFCLPLAAGKSGVQKIESVALANTTGAPTAGTVNIIVARPLFYWRSKVANDGGTMSPIETGCPIIYTDSALQVAVCPDSTSSGIPDVLIEVANG